MHYSAKRGIEIACRLSIRPSVCLPVTLADQDHTGWAFCIRRNANGAMAKIIEP